MEPERLRPGGRALSSNILAPAGESPAAQARSVRPLSKGTPHMNERGAPDTRPGPLRWGLTLLGCGILLFAWKASGQSAITRLLMTLGGLAIILLAPAVVRSLIGSVAVTDLGVTGAGFLGPVYIPWGEVVRVYDDSHGITVQSASRSARIELSTVSVRSTVGSGRFSNFSNTDAMVRFLLAHIPKSALLDMRYWLPT